MMGCRVHTSRHGTLTLLLHWRGVRTWESFGERDEPQHRERAEAIAAAVAGEIAEAKFTPMRYLHYFPLGSRAAAMRAELGVGSEGSPTVAAYAETRWLPKQVEPIVRKTKARDVRAHLRKLEATPLERGGTFGQLKMTDVEPAHIDMLQIYWLKQSPQPKRRKKNQPSAKKATTKKTLAVNTVKTPLGTLSRMFESAVREGLCESNPCLGLAWPRKPRRTVDPLTEGERDTVIEHLAGRQSHYLHFFVVLLYSGMRPSEAVALRWSDVDLEGGMATIGKSRVLGADNATKTEASERSIRLLDPVAAAVRELAKDQRGEFVFTGPTGLPLNQDRVRERQWNPMLAALKIRPRRLYECRATFISWALTNDVNIKWLAEYCGTSVSMIERHYGRFLKARETEQLSKLSTAKALTKERGSTEPVRKSALLKR